MYIHFCKASKSRQDAKSWGLQGIDERNSLSGDKVTSVDYNPRKQATEKFPKKPGEVVVSGVFVSDNVGFFWFKTPEKVW